MLLSFLSRMYYHRYYVHVGARRGRMSISSRAALPEAHVTFDKCASSISYTARSQARCTRCGWCGFHYYHICICGKGFKERKMKSRKILSLSAHFIKMTSIQSYYAINCLFWHGISKLLFNSSNSADNFGHHKVHLHFNSTSKTTSV